MTLRRRIPQRGRKSPPIDIVRGVVVETWMISDVGRVSKGGATFIEARDYAHDVVRNGRRVFSGTTTLQHGDDDRQAWERHWRLRGFVRSCQKRLSGPDPLPPTVRRGLARRRRAARRG